MDKLAFSGKRIAIIGLGLMGGSLAMSLHGKCDSLFGADGDPETVKYARKLNIFTQVATDPEEVLPHSNVVILATPIRAIVQLIQKLPDIHPGGAIVLDIGSTKQEILEAYQELPPRFIPIGGHPMCGKETSSIVHADPAIFGGAVFALSPLERTSQEVCEFANQLVLAIGSKPVWVDAETHDRWVASISHLPYLLSLSLALATPEDAKTLSGPGYKGMARLAHKPSSMMVDILQTNQEQILLSIDRFSEQLQELSSLIKNSEFDKIAGLIEGQEIPRDDLIKAG